MLMLMQIMHIIAIDEINKIKDKIDLIKLSN